MKYSKMTLLAAYMLSMTISAAQADPTPSSNEICRALKSGSATLVEIQRYVARATFLRSSRNGTDDPMAACLNIGIALGEAKQLTAAHDLFESIPAFSSTVQRLDHTLGSINLMSRSCLAVDTGGGSNLDNFVMSGAAIVHGRSTTSPQQLSVEFDAKFRVLGCE